MYSSIFSRDVLRVGLLVAALEVGDDALEASSCTSAGARSGCGTRCRCRSPLVPYRKQSCDLLRQLLPRRVQVDLVALGDRLRSSARSSSTRSWTTAGSRPRSSDSDGSGTTSSGSISICEPSPVQRGQAPCGELNENIRGSSSGIEVPQLQAGEALASTSSTSPARRRPRSRRSPPPAPTAVSIESASRLRRSGRITRRSTTTAMSCLYFLSSSIVLLEPAQLAVDLHAREALGAQLLEELAVLALAAAHDRRQHHEPRALRRASSPGR